MGTIVRGQGQCDERFCLPLLKIFSVYIFKKELGNPATLQLAFVLHRPFTIML